MADRMCCFGNCDNETVAIIVTIKGNPGERMVFCCLDHASYKLEAMATRQAALSSTNLCTCAAMGKKNIPHARNCPALSPADGKTPCA